MSNARCVVLVPVAATIDPRCEVALGALERRGYAVRRVLGYSAIDFGRSSMASLALADGFDEFLWIDSDIVFHPDDVERLRGHGVPLVGGVYAKKGKPEFACEFLPDTRQMTLGTGGGLVEVRYLGSGFLLARREVYEGIRQMLELPECNQQFGRPIVPYYLPMLLPHRGGRWYLSEDYAFCERARQCGFATQADTAIRLEHIGGYGFTWEDVGRPKQPIPSYACNFNWQTGEGDSNAR
jgi:hypothetical protein